MYGDELNNVQLFIADNPRFKGRTMEHASYGMTYTPLIANTANQRASFRVDPDEDFIACRLLGSLASVAIATYPDVPVLVEFVNLSTGQNWTNPRGLPMEYSTLMNRNTSGAMDMQQPDFPYPLLLSAETEFAAYVTSKSGADLMFYITFEGYRALL